MTAVDVDRLASVAVQLAARVRDENPEDVGLWLAGQVPDPADWFRLAFVQAAAVPVDVPWSELTSWARDLVAGRPVPAGDVEVDEELAGECDPARLRPRERQAVVAQLTRQGLTARQIAGRLGLSRRQVYRHRGAAGVAK
jgi:Homeodomain-like domain